MGHTVWKHLFFYTWQLPFWGLASNTVSRILYSSMAPNPTGAFPIIPPLPVSYRNDKIGPVKNVVNTVKRPLLHLKRKRNLKKDHGLGFKKSMFLTKVT